MSEPLLTDAEIKAFGADINNPMAQEIHFGVADIQRIIIEAIKRYKKQTATDITVGVQWEELDALKEALEIAEPKMGKGGGIVCGWLEQVDREIENRDYEWANATDSEDEYVSNVLKPQTLDLNKRQ